MVKTSLKEFKTVGVGLREWLQVFAANYSVPTHLSAFPGRAIFCLPGVYCTNTKKRFLWQFPLKFQNRGAPARHLLALNESCLHGPMRFIAPANDCLTGFLHTVIYSASLEWCTVRSPTSIIMIYAFLQICKLFKDLQRALSSCRLLLFE